MLTAEQKRAAALLVTPARILFVDDEPSIRATLPLVLRKHGFQVTVASSTAEALAEIDRHEFDLLLCDLNLKTNGDGLEIIGAMRSAHPRCITVILTGYPGVESAIEGIHLGVDDYVIKPTQVDSLLAILAERLKAREPKARILSVSYDEILLRMRHMILENEGYSVISAHGLENSLAACEKGGFDLFILGHSIPDEDKYRMVEAFRRQCSGQIISLTRGASESRVDGADFHIEPDPEPLLKLLAEITAKAVAETSLLISGKNRELYTQRQVSCNRLPTQVEAGIAIFCCFQQL